MLPHIYPAMVMRRIGFLFSIVCYTTTYDDESYLAPICNREAISMQFQHASSWRRWQYSIHFDRDALRSLGSNWREIWSWCWWSSEPPIWRETHSTSTTTTCHCIVWHFSGYELTEVRFQTKCTSPTQHKMIAWISRKVWSQNKGYLT